MANASAKRIGGSLHSLHASLLTHFVAHQNETVVKTLKLGMIIPTVLSLLLRILFRRSSLPPSKSSLAIYIITFFPAFFLSNYLVKLGTTRRDPMTGTLISYGEDLNQPGVTEWCFDILYVTCKPFFSGHLQLDLNITFIGACQIGSGAFGEWFWWLYMAVSLVLDFQAVPFTYILYQIPLYAIYKLWSAVISPMFLGKPPATVDDGAANKETTSKRQEKLRKRSERGDPRVRTQLGKK